MNHNEKYIGLDLLRGVSALLVCAGHIRNFLFVDYGEVESPGLLGKLFYFATGLGHSAVIVFFVLSGYFVGGSVWRQVRSGGFDWGKYLLARLSRLWVVLIPALLLTLVLDGLGTRLLGGAGYDGRWHALLSSGPGSGGMDVSPLTLAGNVFFLQTIAVPVLGTNGPLWSLANEFWYYLMFPFLALGLVRRSFLYWGAAAILCLGLGSVQPGIASGFLFWLMGWLAARQEQSTLRVSGGLAFMAATAFVAALASTKLLGAFQGELAVATATWLLLRILPQVRMRNRVLARGASGLADMSYSLYLFHFPFLSLCWFAFLAPIQLQPSLFSYGQFFALLAGTLLLGFAMWWLFERHTDYLRNILKARLGMA